MFGGQWLVSERRRRRVVGRNHEKLVDEPGEGCPDERADPVDPVVPPPPPDERRPERPCRVHGGTVEGPAGEDVGADHEADRQRRDGGDVAALRVDGGGVDCVDQPERHDNLEEHRVPLADPRRHRKAQRPL